MEKDGSWENFCEQMFSQTFQKTLTEEIEE